MKRPFMVYFKSHNWTLVFYLSTNCMLNTYERIKIHWLIATLSVLISLLNFLLQSPMEQSCSVLSTDIHHGLIIWKAWRKKAPGVITLYFMLQQTATILVFVWSAVLAVISWSVRVIPVSSKAIHLWLVTFMSCTMWAFDSNKVQDKITFSR